MNNQVVFNISVIKFSEHATLEVYTFQTESEFNMKAPYASFYWKDAGSPQGYGPFGTILETLRHHESIVMQFRAAESAQNVIRVDFMNRRRIK